MQLVALLLAVVLSSACKRQPSPTVFLDPGLATLVPSDTVFLAGVRMEQLRQTPIFQRHVMQGKVPAVEKFKEETGLDLRKDIWEVLVAYDGKNGVVMLRGKFTEMGMEPRLQREGIERFGYKGYTMLGDERNAVAFLNPTTAIAGAPSVLRRIIDRRNEAAGAPKRLDERIKQIPSTNQAWIAGDFSSRLHAGPDRDLGRFGAIAQLLGNVQLVSGGIDMRKGFDAILTATVPAQENAIQLKDAVSGLIGFGRLNTGKDQRELLRLYDSIQVEAGTRQVQIKIALPEELLEELIRLTAKFNRASQPESHRPDSSSRHPR